MRQPNDSESIAFEDPETARELFGPLDAWLRALSSASGAAIDSRGATLTVTHPDPGLRSRLLLLLTEGYRTLRGGGAVSGDDLLRAFETGDPAPAVGLPKAEHTTFVTPRRSIGARNRAQAEYMPLLRQSEMVFATGPAGTGKTYLAVAMAVSMLQNKSVKKIILTRPAVEAGEKLGFLPGDMTEKIDPYLRPLYDALEDMLGHAALAARMESGLIEVAPLAFMRGRTLSDAFLILDEAQNTTGEQMKMFLTRLGFGSRAVITGDVTQIDLPRAEGGENRSGLVKAIRVLSGVPGIAFHSFSPKDVVRHPLVGRIVDAYERHEKEAMK